MVRRIYLAGIMAAAITLPASAKNIGEFVTVRVLAKKCEDASVASQMFCIGYLSGVSQAMAINDIKLLHYISKIKGGASVALMIRDSMICNRDSMPIRWSSIFPSCSPRNT